MRSFRIGDLTIPIPIVQGGMGIGISLSGLASAVANAGGIGVIAAVGVGLIHGSPQKSYRQNNKEGIIKEIQKARNLTKGILGVNIMSVLSNYSELVKTVIDEKIDIIFSGAGLPLDLPKYKPSSSQTKLVPIVSSGRAAKIIAQKWKNAYNYLPDAFVVEGPKAGGHLGFKVKELTSESTQLEKLVVDVLTVTNDLKEKHNKNIPIIAAGGVTTGKQIHQLLELGASAVQIGTRFIVTKECDASEEFKNAIVNSDKNSIQIIKSPLGLPGRAIQNEFLMRAEKGLEKPKSCQYNCMKSCNPKTTSFCIAEALLSAYYGKLGKGFAFTGANGHLMSSISTVDEVFRQLMGEYKTEMLKKIG